MSRCDNTTDMLLAMYEQIADTTANDSFDDASGEEWELSEIWANIQERKKQEVLAVVVTTMGIVLEDETEMKQACWIAYQLGRSSQ